MTRTRARGTLLLTLAALALFAADARAQAPGASATVVGAWSVDDDLTPGLTPTTLEAGWLTGLQADLYPGGGALGIRLAGYYTRRALESTADEYSLLTADLGFTFRLTPLESLGSALPYVALTAGGTMYQSVDAAPAFGDGAFGGDPVYRAHATAALGLDIPVSYRTAVRLEAGDRVIFPSVGESPTTDGFPTVHTPVIIVGMQYRLAMPPVRRPTRRPPAPVEAPAEEPEPEPQAVAARDTVQAEPPPVEVQQAAEEAAPPVEEPQAPEVPAAEAEQPVFTVQVQSFLGRSTARRWGQRAEAQGLPVWYLDVEVGGAAASRLRIGATADEARARELAAAVQETFGWTVTVQRIGADDAVPPEALQRTRDFLTRQ